MLAAGVLNAVVFALLVIPADDEFGGAPFLSALAAFPWVWVGVLGWLRRSDPAKSNTPLIVAAILMATAISLVSYVGVWAGSCWECHEDYHDALPRENLFFIYTIWIWVLLSVLLVVLALLVASARFFDKLRRASRTPS